MTTISVTDIPSAIRALRDFGDNLPVSTPEQLATEIAGAVDEASPVDAIMRAGEALYAHLGSLTIAGKQLLRDLISLATTFGWHGLATDQRGLRIVKAARRELGEESPSGSWPDPSEDPAPLERYLETEEEEETPPEEPGDPEV
jgi:hypothetical protein